MPETRPTSRSPDLPLFPGALSLMMPTCILSIAHAFGAMLLARPVAEFLRRVELSKAGSTLGFVPCLGRAHLIMGQAHSRKVVAPEVQSTNNREVCAELEKLTRRWNTPFSLCSRNELIVDLRTLGKIDLSQRNLHGDCYSKLNST